MINKMELKPLTCAKINLAALKENLATVRSLAGSGVRVMSVVKADAYGHGVKPVSKTLAEAGTDSFGVANVDEACELKDIVGDGKDIYILSGCDEHGIPEVVSRGFIPIVYDLGNLKLINDEAKKAGKRTRVHLKFDTSMGRLGFFPHEAKNVFTEAKGLDNIIIDGVMSHFASADEDDLTYSLDQLNNFKSILTAVEELGLDPEYKHIANSAGTINIKDSHLNMVRPGIMLFGSAPSQKMDENISLKPVMSLHSHIIQVKEFPAGKSISYSRTFTTGRKSVIAVIPIGYGDGYSRLLSNSGHVIVNGERAPVVGNVTMDLTMIDITDIKSARVGDEVTLLGAGINAWELAELTNTISYEIFTGIGKRVPRVSI
jgi:alanine racemase